MKKSPLRTVLRLIIILAVLAVLGIVTVFLVRWTNNLKQKKNLEALKAQMKKVWAANGESGILDLVGVTVNGIYYGDDGITLFEGDGSHFDYSAEEFQNISVYEKCNRSVVFISASVKSDPLIEISTGSGTILTVDGYILTNEHVIKNYDTITVKTYDDKDYLANVVGSDTENDIAVLKISTEGKTELTPIEFGVSANLKVGQKVYAIGNPFGYERTLTGGLVAGIGRPVRNDRGNVIMGMIQTDASINPGNSGGPLLDGHGRMVGINSSVYSTSDNSKNMGFATPSDTVAGILPEIIEKGRVTRGWIDVLAVQLTPAIVDYMKLNVNSGILISQTMPGGKAEKSGLKGGNERVKYGQSVIYMGGDVITSINGIAIKEYNDIFTALTSTHPGDKVSVKVIRNGTELMLNVELVERTNDNISWIIR